MNCYRCNGALRYDREAPYCVMCGRFQYPEAIKAWNERPRTKSRQVIDRTHDVRTLDELVAEQAKELPKAHPKQGHGCGFRPPEKDGRAGLSEIQREWARTHVLSAGAAPKNRQGEGR